MLIRRGTSLKVLNLGLKPYSEVWELQKQLQQELISGTAQETLIICQHNPVITLGTSADSSNILVNEAILKEKSVELFKIERGGDVTFHGPGQLVAYPILNLNNHRRDVDWYLRTLEAVIIQTLKVFDIEGYRITGKTGVWIHPHDDTSSDAQRERKIASIGVRLSRWCSMHGLALNIKDCSAGFSLINPCGFNDIVSTSIEQEGIIANHALVETGLVSTFKELFGYL